MSLSSTPVRLELNSSTGSLKGFKNIFKSSPKREITPPITPKLEISPPPTPKTPSSLESSPTRNFARCHQCLRLLTVNHVKELFLAIKCTCLEAPCYFCTRECHRAHWITMNNRSNSCQFYDFKDHLEKNTSEFPLATSLDWSNIEYIHNLYHYKDCF